MTKLTSWKFMKAYPTLALLAMNGIDGRPGNIDILAVVGKVCEVLADAIVRWWLLPYQYVST